ncbi:MAG: bifunctional glutamate N-acetyltransferase/amino-acid acetyltransferase ArgJ [Candidatus Omnitrophota bacterium]|jgi:glutamate N-acetyltransferase/amino-acid N-acetyltransferase|nr:bifunctional glutamate N-acetyltransferase/amino-acid acetyltransferase ArgJ [Candidatus Omnitrophota bacterium]MDD5518080.1 bifunctional glutamate N-acetyltransferase/amino-acid acetyltransferase ArgJ [Candidatus Omnitrophota bacterium]
MKTYKKGILPVGFKASGISCGLKRSGKPDLALFFSENPALASCVFTTNDILAAPVVLSKAHLKNNSSFQAIIANSANANCFTGSAALKDAGETARVLAKALGLRKECVLVASTGIIGKRLPVLKIKRGIPEVIKKLSSQGIDKAAKAIMTTDTFAKIFSVKFNVGAKEITVCGVAKGAGMIAPNMATLLSFIFTDAQISQGALNKALKQAVDVSFNSITVDGCMSTNDSVMLLANAKAGNPLINQGKNLNLFTQALSLVCLELAKMIVRDAEGASKFIKITVKSARDQKTAKAVALNIANSNLFKTAVYGENPNFGRIASAAGSCGAGIKEGNLKIKVSSLKKKDIDVEVSLNQGNSGAVVYTSDLTPEYIKINAEYN